MYKSIKEDEDDDVSLKDFISQKNPSKRSTILNKDEKDIEKLKKEMGITDKK